MEGTSTPIREKGASEAVECTSTPIREKATSEAVEGTSTPIREKGTSEAVEGGHGGSDCEACGRLGARPTIVAAEEGSVVAREGASALKNGRSARVGDFAYTRSREIGLF